MRKACTAHKFTLASNLFSEGVVAFSRTEQHSNGLSQRRLQHLVLTSQLRPFATVFGYVCTKTWHAWEAKQSVSPRWWRDALGVNPPWNQQPTAQKPLPLGRSSVRRQCFMSINIQHEKQKEALIQVWELSRVLNCRVPEYSYISVFHKASLYPSLPVCTDICLQQCIKTHVN